MKPTVTEEVSEFNQEATSPMWMHKPYKSILIVLMHFYINLILQTDTFIECNTNELLNDEILKTDTKFKP